MNPSTLPGDGTVISVRVDWNWVKTSFVIDTADAKRVIGFVFCALWYLVVERTEPFVTVLLCFVC